MGAGPCQAAAAEVLASPGPQASGEPVRLARQPGVPAGEAPTNKTKTKKLIIFGFFLINIQTGPAGSSALEGAKKKEGKKNTPNPTQQPQSLTFLPLCLSLIRAWPAQAPNFASKV